MKHFFPLALLLMASLAQAVDLAPELEKICQGPEVLKEKGEKGSCRMVITNAKAPEAKGACVGLFKGFLPCVVSYVVTTEGAAVQLLCGQDPDKPTIKQVMGAKVDALTVSAVVNKEDGSMVVMPDERQLMTVEAGAVTMVLSESQGKIDSIVTINLKTGPVALTNLSCEME